MGGRGEGRRGGRGRGREGWEGGEIGPPEFLTSLRLCPSLSFHPPSPLPFSGGPTVSPPGFFLELEMLVVLEHFGHKNQHRYEPGF